MEREMAMQEVVAAVNECLAKETPVRGDILVSVTFDLSIALGADGSVIRIGFDPPLPSTVESCSREGAARVRWPTPKQALSVHRKVTLYR